MHTRYRQMETCLCWALVCLLERNSTTTTYHEQRHVGCPFTTRGKTFPTTVTDFVDCLHLRDELCTRVALKKRRTKRLKLLRQVLVWCVNTLSHLNTHTVRSFHGSPETGIVTSGEDRMPCATMSGYMQGWCLAQAWRSSRFDDRRGVTPWIGLRCVVGMETKCSREDNKDAKGCS